MDASPLAKLPPEIRNATFELVLLVPTGITIDLEFWRSDLPELTNNESEVRAALALMTTCRQIRQEALSTFYGANEFIIDMTDLLDEDDHARSRKTVKIRAYLLRGWLQSLGEGARFLRHLVIDLGISKSMFYGTDTNPGFTAEIMNRFEKVTRGTGVKLMFRLVYFWWRGEDEPRLSLGFSSPFGEPEHRTVLQEVERIRNEEEKVEYDPESLEKTLQKLEDCEVQARKLFKTLRHLRSAT